MRKNLVLSWCAAAVLLLACQNHRAVPEPERENRTAKSLLQGIWIDDESETVQFRIEGDTIYYPDPSSVPLYCKIVGDTFFLYGIADSASYRIDRQDEKEFWFYSLSDEIIRLRKSEDALDSMAFTNRSHRKVPIYDQVAKKDSVILYNGRRYRGYVYINPSKIKVTKMTYNETGMGVENVYYDNIIHICVYEGKECLYAKDFSRRDFEELLPAGFFKQAILSDMDFLKVDEKGFGYQATVCIPEEIGCYSIDITISPDGELSLKNSVYP